MSAITDEYMHAMLSTTKEYSLVFWKAGPKENEPEAQAITWEHGRRNFSLRAAGLLAIVGPLVDECEVQGISIFNASREETRKIMDDDPGVKAGVFTYEIHTFRSFPGDRLP